METLNTAEREAMGKRGRDWVIKSGDVKANLQKKQPKFGTQKKEKLAVGSWQSLNRCAI